MIESTETDVQNKREIEALWQDCRNADFQITNITSSVINSTIEVRIFNSGHISFDDMRYFEIYLASEDMDDHRFTVEDWTLVPVVEYENPALFDPQEEFKLLISYNYPGIVTTRSYLIQIVSEYGFSRFGNFTADINV